MELGGPKGSCQGSRKTRARGTRSLGRDPTRGHAPARERYFGSPSSVSSSAWSSSSPTYPRFFKAAALGPAPSLAVDYAARFWPIQPSHGHVNEQGILYTALAGLLNLLTMIDVLFRGWENQAPARTPSRGAN